MFAWALSSAIAFIFYGVVFNILSNINPHTFDSDDVINWGVVAVMSALWFISIPLLFVIFITYLLKKLVDKISQVILKRVKK